MDNTLTILENNGTPQVPAEQIKNNLEAPALDPVLLSIANLSLEGKNALEIAEEFDVSPDMVTSVLDKREVKAYIDNVFLSQGYLNRFKRLDLINRVIEHKIQEAIETDVYSSKDILEWIRLLQTMETETRPKQSGPQVAVQVNNNLESLLSKLIDED